MNAIRQFLGRVKKSGTRRPGFVTTVAMGRQREFCAWDVGDDTFVFEKGVAGHLDERPSVLMVEKRDLWSRRPGRVFTMTTGNHSVGAFPLLDGRFWKLSRVPSAKRGEVLMHSILCANVVNGSIEISQRDVPAKKLYAADDWLLSQVGFAMNDIVMGDRNDAVLEHYRALGQEWRVKPLAWTESEMKVALAASKKRIATKLNYYHSARGVHFLSFSELSRFAALAESDPEEFVLGIKELVSVYEGQPCSFCRMPKHRGHHEIELFGLRRGVAQERLVPALEQLMESVALGRLGQLGIIQKTQEILSLYESLLTRPEFADETSKAFVEALYMCITGEIYSIVGEGSTPAFDDRRTALPGATYVGGRAVLHPGADDRSEVLLSNLRGLMSKDEIVVYANVYEIREDETTPIGKGKTREIVFKTNRRPLEKSLIEKRLSSAKREYGSYMLARIGALRALGISLSRNYLLLRRRPQTGRRPVDFYIRERCEGEPMESIPASYFCNADDASVEEKDVVLGLATLMGDAAAQNMAMKKFDPKTNSPLYGVGKEIYEFEYDIIRQRVVPKSVATCSIRGSFGWPDTSFTDENLRALASFYFTHFAHALKIYQKRHAVTMAEVAERFMDGFEYRTHALSWQLSVMRDKFENFKPGLPRSYDFDRKWAFMMWSLERQERRILSLRRTFMEKVALVETLPESERAAGPVDFDDEEIIIGGTDADIKA
jgi:hypothetical protein